MKPFNGGTDRECRIWNTASIEKLVVIAILICDKIDVGNYPWK